MTDRWVAMGLVVLCAAGSEACFLSREGTGNSGLDAAVRDAALPDAGAGDDERDGSARRDAGDGDAGGLNDDGGPVDAGFDAAASIPPDWYDARWGSRHRLEIDNTQASASFVNFPILVTLDGTRVDFTATGPEGEQIRFVDPDGTLLDYEIEYWDSSGEAYVWVRVPTIDGGSASDFIWLYYDHPGALDAQNAGGTWPGPYRAVWHLTDGFSDSSGYNNHGSTSPAVDTDGLIGRARSFDRDQPSTVPDANSLDLTEGVTISAWMRPTDLSHPLSILSKREGCEREGNYAVFIRGDDRVQFEHYDSGWRTFARGTIVVGRWQWVAAVFAPAFDRVSIYIDGVRVESMAEDPYALIPDANAIEIGRNGGCGVDYMEGPLDEVRIEASPRSPDWIATQHRSMTDALLSYGARERIR